LIAGAEALASDVAISTWKVTSDATLLIVSADDLTRAGDHADVRSWLDVQSADTRE
jgi:hypothetical protein